VARQRADQDRPGTGAGNGIAAWLDVAVVALILAVMGVMMIGMVGTFVPLFDLRPISLARMASGP
jgi:hypothetical protein